MGGGHVDLYDHLKGTPRGISRARTEPHVPCICTSSTQVLIDLYLLEMLCPCPATSKQRCEKRLTKDDHRLSFNPFRAGRGGLRRHSKRGLLCINFFFTYNINIKPKTLVFIMLKPKIILQ